MSLEDSAYERLKAAKKPGESFSVTINRILEGSRPSYRPLAGFLTRAEAKQVRRAIERMREAEAPAELLRMAEMRRIGGSHTGH